MLQFRPLCALLDLLFPPACPACDALIASGRALCERCAISLYEVGPACPRCAEPASEARSRHCARCAARPPPFSRTFAAYRYGGELGVALRRLKLERRADIARTLAPLFSPHLAAAADVDFAIPIPLSRRRLAARTFNQSQVLLAHAARGLRMPQRPEALRRLRETPSQAGHGLAARRENVWDAFAVPRAHERSMRGRRILLVDDIMTTGATLSAAAKALLAAGARDVTCFAFARAESG